MTSATSFFIPPVRWPTTGLALAAALSCAGVAGTAAHAQEPVPATAHAPAPAQDIAPAATDAPASAPAAASAPGAGFAPPSSRVTPTVLQPVIVTGRRADAQADVAGFGDVPLSQLPLQAQVFTSAALHDRGAQRLADLVAAQAGVGDAYNAEGYWDFLSLRGFVLDNRSNYRRDGLPINAETSIPLDNKSHVEVLKGLSGMQAGVSAPGGLVNLVVKRPENASLRSASLEWRQDQTRAAALDISQRFGDDQSQGLRINAAYQDLEPRVHNAQGHRHLLAAAGDWRVSASDTLEAEFETSRRVQPSMAGFSLLGNVVPAPGDPTLNLNNQPWSLPVVFDANTASLRWKHQLAEDWETSVHAATQRLRTDDRIAFPFGCGAESLSDRYCSDGTFDFYDFRSEGERRRTDALEAAAQGQLRSGELTHHLRAGVLLSEATTVLPPQAFNPVGPGNVAGTAVTAPDPTLFGSEATRIERSTEAYLRGRSQWEPLSQLWWGLRHTRLARSGGEADYKQSFTTPWLAYTRDLSPQWGPGWMAYASWGQGVETAVAPALPHYTNAGEPLPALRSRQAEAGVKRSADTWSASAALFEIRRPQTTDIGACDPDPNVAPLPNCTRTLDGTQRHRGLEAQFDANVGAIGYGGSATVLAATRSDSVDPTLNGTRPPNVPAHSLRAYAQLRPSAMPGLRVGAQLTYEGARTIVPGDDALRIPGWTRVDLRASHEHIGADGTTWLWRGGIDNVADYQAWRESPFQFGHAYLYPLAPRTVWAGVEVRL